MKCIIAFLGLFFSVASFADSGAVYDLFVAGGTLEAVRTATAASAEGQRVFLAAPRPYCGEDRAATFDLERHADDDVNDPLIREIFNPAYRARGAYNVLPGTGWRAVDKFKPYETVATPPVTGELETVTTPLLIKRACDKALLAAKVEFLTGAQVVSATRGGDGLWQVVYAARDGERTIHARAFADHRVPRRVAKGRHAFTYRVVRGPEPHLESIDFSFDVPFSDARGLLAVENHARSLVAPSNLLDVAEWVVVNDQKETPSAAPVEVRCDVVVAGGGTGGGPAAIAAARAGAKVILIEYQNILGGVSSEGRIGGFGSYYDGNVCGFTKELEDGEREIGGVYFFARGEWLRREIVRLGGEVWLGTMVTGAEMSGSRVIGVKVVLPDGSRGLIRCTAAVDATGNSDLAAAAGAATEFITSDELSLQGCGMAGQPFGASCVNSDIGFVDETDAADLCFFALRSRLNLPDRIWNQSSLVDSRERRRIVGDFRISPIDLLLNRRYPDVICRAKSSFDTHGQTAHPVFFIRDTGVHGEFIHANVPYRALLPRGVEGLLVTGLGLSAHRDAMPVLRMKADIQNQGYAAGVAAAMAVREGVPPRQIDVRKLQQRLVQIGNLPAEVLTWTDTLPLPSAVLECAVKRISDGYAGLPEVMSDPVRALPLLRAQTGFEAAHVRALLGDFTAAPALIAKLENLPWDEGWNFKGMSQYLRSVGTVDRYVIALGRTRAGAALPVLDRLASELTGESAYSHFRALALAYESIGDARGVAALERLLALPGVAGHAVAPGVVPSLPGYSDLPTNKERSDVLRELCVARALFRLGDPSGVARRSLEAYTKDPRRAYANHARQVLTVRPAEKIQIETAELQARIDAVAAAGGGTVSVAAGVHRSGTLVLKDNVTLRLEQGAVLKAVHDSTQFARADGPAFIWATNAVNVAIEGKGTIDGSGDELPRDRDYRPRPRLILFEDCRTVRVEDVSLRASAFWTLVLHRVDGFAIRRVDVLSHAHYNNDGIDLMAKNGVVEDCLVNSDDDGIVLKTLSSDYTVENVTVRRCRVSSNMNLLKIGTETWGGFRNILFEDIKAEVRQPSAVWPYFPQIPNGDPSRPYCKSGLAIAIVDGGTLDGVTVRNVDLKGCLTPIFIRHNRRHVQEGRETYLRNILIENVTAEAASSIASSVTGLADLRPSDITIRDVTFVLPGGCENGLWSRPVPEREEGIPTNLMFDFHPLPAHGFYVRHADRVKIENARFILRRPDARQAIVRDDAE